MLGNIKAKSLSAEHRINLSLTKASKILHVLPAVVLRVKGSTKTGDLVSKRSEKQKTTRTNRGGFYCLGYKFCWW